MLPEHNFNNSNQIYYQKQIIFGNLSKMLVEILFLIKIKWQSKH